MKELGQGQITNITVYNSGAMVTRSATILLEKGVNQARFSDLSLQYQQDYQVTCLGAKVLSVSAERQIVLDYADDISSQIKMLNKKLGKENRLISNLSDEQLFWQKNYKASEGASYSELEKRAIFVKQKLEKNGKETQNAYLEYNETLASIEKLEKIANVSSRTNTLNACVINLFAVESGEYQITISAFTSCASWQPLYKIEKIDGDSLNIILQASLTQNTQEDWRDLPITFTTGSPQSNNSLPEFAPEYLSDEPASFIQENRMMARSVNVLSDKTYSSPIIEKQGESSISFTTEFAVTAKDAQPLVVQLSSVCVKADFEYKCFASVDSNVYLLANIASQTFLQAKANIFINGVFTGSTLLYGATTAITLGVECQITLKRIEGNRFKSNKLLGGNKTECDFKLIVVSGKKEKTDINIIDRLPVSSDKGIEVVPINIGGATLNSTNGKLEFKLTLLPNQQQEINVLYTILKKS